MSKIQAKVAEYFATHPEANEVYEALGVLFTEKPKAEKYLSGVAGRMVTTHTREGINYERESDRLKHEIMQQENLIEEKRLAYEAATSVEKEQAMSEWRKQDKKLEELKHRLEKQLALESKEELIAKHKKADSEKAFEKTPELSKEQLLAKISSQQAVVDANAQLIETLKGKPKQKAQKVQKDEIAMLEKLQAELNERFPDNSEAGKEETELNTVNGTDSGSTETEENTEDSNNE